MNAQLNLNALTARKMSAEEVQLLISQGFMDIKSPYELIDGILVEMPGEGIEHTDWKAVLIRHAMQTLDEKWVVIPDSTLNLSPNDAPQPDMYIYPATVNLRDLKGDLVSLVVEVAHAWLKKDTEFKSAYYAGFGIREYWVLDVAQKQIITHRTPVKGAFTERQIYDSHQQIVAQGVPEFHLCLDALNRLS